MNVTELSPDKNTVESRQAELARLKKAAGEFEAMFINQMLKTMRESEKAWKESEGDTGLGLGTDNPFQEQFDWQLAIQLSERSPLGIAHDLTRMLEKRLGLESPEPTSPREALRYMGSSRTPAAEPLSSPGAAQRKYPANLEEIIERMATEYGIDPAMIRAVISAESAGNTKAVSPKGAKGLMQLIDSTAADVGVKNPFDPEQNVRGGTAYLKRMLERYQGDARMALAAYNAGPGAVDRYGGIPPYPETVNYVRKIMQQLNGAAGTPPQAGEKK